MAHALPSQSGIRLDIKRIAAESGTLALHGVAALMLLAPLSMSTLQDTPKDDPPVVLIERAKPNPPPVPPKVEPEVKKPIEVPVTQPRVVQPPQVLPAATTDTPMPGDTAAQEFAPDAVESGPVAEPALTGPLQGASLQYESAPPPPYPPQAQRDGLTGVVTLQVLVDVDGRQLEVTIARSSGHRVLDNAARRQVLSRWRFRPAMHNGQAVQAIGLIPIDFRVD